MNDFAESLNSIMLKDLLSSPSTWEEGLLADDNVLPYNPATNREYDLFNVLVLRLTGYRDPRWMTREQAEQSGYRIIARSKGTEILVDPDINTSDFTTYTVYNAAQIDGIPAINNRIRVDKYDVLECIASMFKENTGIPILIRELSADEPTGWSKRDQTITISDEEEYDDLDDYYVDMLNVIVQALYDDDLSNMSNIHYALTMLFTLELITAYFNLQYMPDVDFIKSQLNRYIGDDEELILDSMNDAVVMAEGIIQYSDNC